MLLLSAFVGCGESDKVSEDALSPDIETPSEPDTEKPETPEPPKDPEIPDEPDVPKPPVIMPDPDIDIEGGDADGVGW